MTQKELDDIANEIVGNDKVDPAIELEWINEQLTGLSAALSRNIAAAKLYRFMLEEQQLMKLQTETKRLRDCLAYLQARKIELNGG